MVSDTKNLKTLGKSTTAYSYDKPNNKLIETFENQHQLTDHSIKITAPEFTSLCPKTGQPDFATIVVEYTPDKLCVESKSFKLYLGSFRMHGEFHEDCTCRILEDLVDLLDPKKMKVTGNFMPRGGISFVPTAEYYKDLGNI